ncbi:hypothetical protein [Silvibacterium acidisoli]|uniref:hypothetical protein n=1 Tax=Acidobacteriaceae bacterium ZG23-2 TaxID=2883246 RepID=UPI00406CFA61
MKMNRDPEKNPPDSSFGPSWGVMLLLLAVAIVVATLIAYRMVYPFFHGHPH